MDESKLQNGSGTGQENPPATNPPATVSKDEHERELDRYRNQIGQANKQLEELKAELNQLREAGKSEQQKLQEKADRAAALEEQAAKLQQEIEARDKALADEAEARLEKLPEEIRALLLEDLTPAKKLEWIRIAESSADRLKPANNLPPAGQRNPPSGQEPRGVTDEERAANLRKTAARF